MQDRQEGFAPAVPRTLEDSFFWRESVSWRCVVVSGPQVYYMYEPAGELLR